LTSAAAESVSTTSSSPLSKSKATSRPNPSTSIYIAAGRLARFESKKIVFFFEKRSRLLQRWRCSCKFKSRRIGSRVDRFGEFSRLWLLVTLVSFFNCRSYQCIILDKNVLGYILGVFSQTHQVTPGDIYTSTSRPTV
jgi:hypothetical protein